MKHGRSLADEEPMWIEKGASGNTRNGNVINKPWPKCQKRPSGRVGQAQSWNEVATGRKRTYCWHCFRERPLEPDNELFMQWIIDRIINPDTRTSFFDGRWMSDEIAPHKEAK